MQIEVTSEYLVSQGLSLNLPGRFWKKVLKTENCWLWTASVDRWGYGWIGNAFTPPGPRLSHAHRISWILHFGPIPKGLFVLHHCDVPGCVKPDHLFLGTHLDNMRDRNLKGGYRNMNAAKGEDCGNVKLTECQVIEIRRRYNTGTIYQTELAAIYGVHSSQISRIVRGLFWKHI